MFTYFECFCDICVTHMACFWLKSILVLECILAILCKHCCTQLWIFIPDHFRFYYIQISPQWIRRIIYVVHCDDGKLDLFSNICACETCEIISLLCNMKAMIQYYGVIPLDNDTHYCIPFQYMLSIPCRNST